MLSALLQLDRSTTGWVAAQLSAPWLQWSLLVVTSLGSWGFVWLGLSALGWILAPRLVAWSRDAAPTGRASGPASDLPSSLLDVVRLRAALWRAVMAVLFTIALVEGVAKPLVSRERPFVHGPAPSPIVWRPTSTSFPSGHAASAAAGALALSRAWPPAAIPLAILASLVALSRVGLGVHYVGDVLAGLLVGLLAASLAAPRMPRVLRNDHPAN